MGQYLVDAAPQHHIPANKQRHQPIGHAIYRAPPPPAAQTAQNRPP